MGVRLLFMLPSSLCDVSGPRGLPPANIHHLLHAYVSLLSPSLALNRWMHALRHGAQPRSDWTLPSYTAF